MPHSIAILPANLSWSSCFVDIISLANIEKIDFDQSILTAASAEDYESENNCRQFCCCSNYKCGRRVDCKKWSSESVSNLEANTPRGFITH